MNILINISHPAHVHFFKNVISNLLQKGHRIITVSRKKEFATELLNYYRIPHILLTEKGKKLRGLIRELILQQFRLSKIIRTHSPDMMLQIGGIFNAPVGKFYQIPTLAFSDTENEKWGNKLSFALSRHVILPSCFAHHTGGSWKQQIHYPGYHELAYLSPRYAPEPVIPENRFLIRFVGWGAGHDIGETGLSIRQKTDLVNILKEFGEIHISSESPLPDEIARYACTFHPAEIHSVMKKCRMIVGESATMTSEAACLGIPAIFISNTGRGYTTEQDVTYGLVKHYTLHQWDEIFRQTKIWAGRNMVEQWQEKRRNMLKDKIEVTDWLLDLIENYPDSIREARKGNFERYLIKCAA